MLGHRFSNRDVETAVQSMELLNGNWRVLFHSELGDDLTHVAVVVDHLRYGAAGRQEFRAVPRRTDANGVRGEWCIGRLQAERLRELSQEQRDAVLNLAR